jgi:hypothetical protein
LNAELVLELIEQSADSGLAAPKHLGCAADRPGKHHGTECSKITQVHKDTQVFLENAPAV